MTFIVVDDEAAAIDRIAQLVLPFQHWILRATFTEPANALAYLAKHHVDFVLLDMEMPLIDGRAFMLQMPLEVKVILYTAHDEYATDGFDYDVVDFLKKPVSLERFNKAMTKMARALKFDAREGPQPTGDYYYFMLRGPIKHMRTKINLDELVYIESKENETYFYLVGEMEPDGLAEGIGEIPWDSPKKPLGRVSSERLRELMDILKGTSFMRIHRSIILNTHYFGTYEHHTVKLRELRTVLPVGKRANYPNFFDWMDRHYLPGA